MELKKELRCFAEWLCENKIELKNHNCVWHISQYLKEIEQDSQEGYDYKPFNTNEVS